MQKSNKSTMFSAILMLFLALLPWFLGIWLVLDRGDAALDYQINMQNKIRNH